jgi:hypothetical protein
MTKKKWLIVLIIAFPSFFWLILETSTINSRKLPFYGPRKVIAAGDTDYYRVTDRFYMPDTGTATLHQVQDPLYAIAFISQRYRKDAYRLTGLWEYLNYKNSKVEHIPFILVTESEKGNNPAGAELKKLSTYPNVSFYTWPRPSFDSLSKTYFKEKPYYIDYSFFLLVDANRHIRGYYDGRYVSEFKRLIEEYQHLRLKEEKQKLIETNEIKSPS